MKAAVEETGAPLHQAVTIAPGPDDAVIAVRACGIDGTDLKLLDGFGYTPDLPFIMGHEVAGVVESVGARVDTTRPGDRVVVYNFLIPPESPWYRGEREQLATDMLGVVGVKGHSGGYAEKLRVAARQLVAIPEGVGWRDAAVHCDAGLTAWHAVGRSHLAAGETVLVIGVGGVGSFAVQFARLAGARVVAAERTQAKLDWARKLGVDEAILFSEIAARVRDLSAGHGADCVLDIVGTAETMTAAIDAVAVGGRIVVVGYTPDSFALAGKRLAQNELEVIGSRAGSRQDLAAALALTAARRILSIVTDHAPLDAVNEALAKLARGDVLGRLVLDIGADSG
jgi:D-arabinose 1-dehydrogenase-like Zn-dependent alcohol dehydrogenase